MSAIPPAVAARLRGLPTGLRDHVERARREARDLARRHGVDETRVDLAVAAHDLARALDDDALIEQAAQRRIRVHPVERASPPLLHGRIAANWLKTEAGIDDEDVLEAVRWHTTGRKSMGPVAKVVFLADKLDPEKVRRYPYLEKVKTLAHASLDGALLEYLDRELSHLVRQGYLIHPASIGLRNELLTCIDRTVRDRR